MENSLLPGWTEGFVPRGLVVQSFSSETADCEVRTRTNASCYGMHALTVAPGVPNQEITVRSAADSLLAAPALVLQTGPGSFLFHQARTAPGAGNLANYSCPVRHVDRSKDGPKFA